MTHPSFHGNGSSHPFLPAICLALAVSGCDCDCGGTSGKTAGPEDHGKHRPDAGADAGFRRSPAIESEAQVGPPIKVGLLYSLTGALATDESPLKDMALMAIAEINEHGGIMLNRRKVPSTNERGGADVRHALIPIVLDADSNWPTYEDKAGELVANDRVAAVFGGSNPESRRSMIRAFNKHDGMLLYAVAYAGGESSFHVFYTGSVPHQHAIPAIRYLRQETGARRFVLLGTDTVYARAVNNVVRHYLMGKQLLKEDVLEIYAPTDQDDYEPTALQVKEFVAAGGAAVLCTLKGEANRRFFEALGQQEVHASDVPVMMLTVTERELLDKRLSAAAAGHFVASSYLTALQNPQNRAFKARWVSYVRRAKLGSDAEQPITAAMEATYVGVHLWAQAAQQAGTIELDAVRQAMAGQRFLAPSGVEVEMDMRNHHLHKPLFIGDVQANGRVTVRWASKNTIAPRTYSPFVPGNAGRIADWTYPWLCGDCTKPRIESPVRAR